DVVTVAGALALQRFAVAGWSGGGPHALAVAALAGDRVTRCAALSSVAPLDAPGLDWFAGMSPSNVEEFDAALSGEGTLEPALTPVAAAVSDDVYAFIAALPAERPPL